jgi:multiple sugar transport system substrate-binding protein
MMTKSIKLQGFILGICFAGIIFSACSSRNTENQGPSANTGQSEMVLQFWHHYSAQSPENDTLVTVLIPRFEAENPGIKVNAVPHEWANLHDKILISAQSKTLPDVARLDSAWIPEFHAMDILVALDVEVGEFASAAGNLLESAMSTARIGSHYYGLALNTNTKILFYNTQAFASADIAPPATMDEFIFAAKALAGKNAAGQQVWGYNEPGLFGWNLCPFIWSFGGELTNPEQTAATGYINSPRSIAAIEALSGLYAQGAITGWNSGDIPMTDGFGTGRYMMLLEGPWKIAELAGAYPDFKYATAVMPAGEGGSHSVLGGEDISMFNSANKEAAWKFMRFMTGEFAQTEMAKCGQIPVNKTALNSDLVKGADFAPFIEAIATARSRPTVAVWNEMDNGLNMAIDAVIRGEKTAKAAMDELARQWDTLLQR